MLMHCLEWWLYEIVGFLAGIISEVELGAQSVVYNLAAIVYVVIPLHSFYNVKVKFFYFSFYIVFFFLVVRMHW